MGLFFNFFNFQMPNTKFRVDIDLANNNLLNTNNINADALRVKALATTINS